ncbi:hypothetical protein [Bradyrhizobium iriomotense]|uniref:hypothetical protein n=1 Tax=Bradyrhizobium iriomotense TaxID=441950 RepID=UPI0024E0A2F4|nr:hypothetical protein [Bradyrhizobium iriomotense]
MRRRSSPHTFEDGLAAGKARLEQRAAKLKPGREQEDHLSRMHRLDTAADMIGSIRQDCRRRGKAVIQEPQFDTYSVQARICLGVAIFGAALFLAGLLMSFFTQ